MGVPAGVPKGPRRPSHVAYYVALVGILSLLVLLCLYFFYYFVKKVKELSSADSLSLPTTSCRPPPAGAAYPVQPELSSADSLSLPTTSCRPPPAGAAYPVQPVVRDTASAMAMLCKQVPPSAKGGTVFPTSTSPAALRTNTGDDDPTPQVTQQRAERANEPKPERPTSDSIPDKAPPVPAVSVTAPIDVDAR